ncbi:MAG: GNAT family N-acetyltransferase [Nocardioides sp.]|nr:GNAT family N-acetyltransferase [Nocardioides sp.]
MDYDFRRLDLHDDSEKAVAMRQDWVRAMRDGFRAPVPDEQFHERWLRRSREDGLVCTGAWLRDPGVGTGRPVATYSSFDKEVNVGLAQVPTRLVTDVTTSPAHLRRGLLRRLIEDDLADAKRAGLALAGLTAADATIYGRWGFGVATLRRTVEVAGGRRFALRDFTDSGRVELVDPPAAWPVVSAIHDRFRATTRGAVQWPAVYEDIHSGTFDYNTSGPDTRLKAALHLDATGEPDGFVLFKYESEGGKDSISVAELVGLSPHAWLGLWRLLASIDQIEHVTHGIFHPQDPLPWALTDINAVRVKAESEFLWLRVLDVPDAFQARPWAADGQVLVGVADAQGHAAGTWAMTSRDGRAEVTSTEADPEVRTDAETLATLLLGTAPVATLQRAGRIHGDPEAVARFGEMADLPTPPYSLTGF